MKRATGDPHTGSTYLVQHKEGENVIDILKASAINAEIQRVTEKRFELANSTPIQHSSLRQLVGFCTLTTYAKELLQGKLAIPTDIDEAMIELIQEMQQLWMRMRPFHGHTEIMPEVYKYYWGGVNESTSLALSKIHFRNWKAWRLSLARVDKGGLLSAKFNCLHWGPTLVLGEWPSSATREGPGSSLGGQATGYLSDGG
jgi:hypothetical protein